MLITRRAATVLKAQFFLLPSAVALIASSSKMPSCRIIDSAIHLWSTGAEPFPWVAPPPADLQALATPEAYIAAARDAGVSGALVVQPANHLYDHSYVAKAIREHPDFFRGMGLANPTLPAADAVAALEELHAAGFVGVRFNAGQFTGGLASEVGRALYRRAGELLPSDNLILHCTGELCMPWLLPKATIHRTIPDHRTICSSIPQASCACPSV